ncbi:ATP-binding protein [Amycolatopsis sp. H6(2020)]|nr:ATP-binding protein [Amycolatopsis sp. H6(2020)]
MPIEFLADAERLAAAATSLPAFSGFDLLNFKAELAEALTNFGRLGIFEEYTKHDITHVDGLLGGLDVLITERTKLAMTPADWLLTVLAGYLHDFGLLVTRDEYESRSRTAFVSYKTQVLSDVENAALVAYVNTLEAADADRFLYQEFVRENHARRVRGWILNRPDVELGYDRAVVSRFVNLLQHLDEAFLADLAYVCESHHEEDLYNTDKYHVSQPYGNSDEETANVQFAAILLRTADLLHITNDRVPSMAFAVVNPRNPKSQQEWAKQKAVRRIRSKRPLNSEGNVDLDLPRDTIEVFAQFDDADGYFGLTSYLKYAEKQLQECHAWASEANKKCSVPHEFPWRRIDTTQIKAVGFSAEQFEFKIDQYKILDLLTGHTLYNDTGVVVRELVQNGVDAARLQAYVDKNSDYVPNVSVHWNPAERELTVVDNGTGMSQKVIEDNFLKVGSSRYQEAKFGKDFPGFSPISRFGIGVLSAFMVADDVQVKTVSEEEREARHLTLRSVHGTYLVKFVDKDSAGIPAEIRRHGTSVSLKMRPDARLDDVKKILDSWVVVPGVNVTVSIGDQEPSVVGFKSPAEALMNSMLQVGPYVRHAEREDCLTDERKSLIEIREVEVDGLSIAYAVRWNKWFSQWVFVGLSDVDRRSVKLGTCVEGIRVTSTTPGFTGNHIWSIANCAGRRSPKTNVARNSFERTSEYLHYVDAVFDIYFGHVSGEVNEMSANRGFSITKAVNEAAYLSVQLVDSGQDRESLSQVELDDALKRAMSKAPLFLVENSVGRRAVSLRDLSENKNVVIRESALVRHLEYVLGAIPTDSSITEMLGSIVKGRNFSIDHPVLCSSNWLSRTTEPFFDRWFPKRIVIDENAREIESTWVEVDESPQWFVYKGSTPEIRLLNRSAGRRVCFPLSGEIEFFGLAHYDAVRVCGHTFLAHNHPIVELVTAKNMLGDRQFIELILFFASSSLSERFRAANGELENITRALLSRINDLWPVDLVDEETAQSLLKNFASRTFDIDQWERRL